MLDYFPTKSTHILGFWHLKHSGHPLLGRRPECSDTWPSSYVARLINIKYCQLQWWMKCLYCCCCCCFVAHLYIYVAQDTICRRWRRWKSLSDFFILFSRVSTSGITSLVYSFTSCTHSPSNVFIMIICCFTTFLFQFKDFYDFCLLWWKWQR